MLTYRGKSADELELEIKDACPDGVDIYMDHTGGDISDAVIENYNDYARIVVVGRTAIAHLADTKLDVGRRDNNVILHRRIIKSGFVGVDYSQRAKGAIIQLAKWVNQGVITVKEDIMHGINETPDAFMRMMEGQSEGKQLVHLSDVDVAAEPQGPAKIGRLMVAPWFPTMKVAKKMTGLGYVGEK